MYVHYSECRQLNEMNRDKTRRDETRRKDCITFAVAVAVAVAVALR